jgi:predicted nucleic acid-binding Zn finger protein
VTVTDPVADWQDRLAEAGSLEADIVERIVAVHDDRGARAVELVSEGRVKEYNDFTVVVGTEDEYVIEDGSCTCKDASYNLDATDPTARCAHALAADIARRVDAVDRHDMWYAEVRDLL